MGNYKIDSDNAFYDLTIFYEKYKDKLTNLEEFISWYKKKLYIHYFWKNRFKWKIRQYSIFLANLWKNIDIEINKLRPVLIVSWTSYSSVWKDVWMVPITKLYDEKGKKKLSKAYSNYHDALKRLRQIEYFKNHNNKK